MEKLVEQFSSEAIKAGATVRGPCDLSVLNEYLFKVMASKKPRRVAGYWFSDELIGRLTPFLRQQSWELITGPQSPEVDFDIGITEVNFGIAQTGTIGLESGSPSVRKASALPLVHIAILNQSKILAGWPEALELINRTSSKYYALITGPSRTADIERVLTLGVHGPEELYIIIVK